MVENVPGPHRRQKNLKKSLKVPFATGGVLSLILLKYGRTAYFLSDASFLMGCVFLVFGFGKLAARLGLYGSVQFGTKKFMDILLHRKSTPESYFDYLEATQEAEHLQEDVSYKEMLVVSVILFVFSLASALV